MEKVRLAVVGTGPRIIQLLKLYIVHPNLEIVAICDRYEYNVKEAEKVIIEKFPDVKEYLSYDKMMEELLAGGEKKADALFIGIDPQEQVDMACDAMEKGFHVMTEVPAAYTIEQCWKLVHTVEKTGMKYQLAEQTRYWDFIAKWREMAEKDAFGKILLVEGEYMHYEPNWDYFYDESNGDRFFGPVLPEDKKHYVQTWRYKSFRNPIYYLPHTLSPLLSILDDRVTKVACMGNRLGSYQVEGLQVRDIESAIMKTEKDTVMRVSAGFTSKHGHRKGTYSHWYQVRGTERTVEWSRSEIDEPKMWTEKDGWQEMDWTTQDKNAEEFIQKSGHGGADWWPIDSFIKAILNDTTPPMDVYKAVESAAPAIMAAKSAEQGGVMLEVPNFRKSARENENK